MSTAPTPEPKSDSPNGDKEPAAVAPIVAPNATPAPVVVAPTPVVIPAKASREELGKKLNELQKDALTHAGEKGHNPFIWLKENLNPLRLELESAKVPTAGLEAKINALKYAPLPIIVAKGVLEKKDTGPVDHVFQNNLTVVQPKSTGLAS